MSGRHLRSSTMNDMSGLLALYNLLSQVSTLPCSNGARAFLSLLTSEDDRFSLAIDGFIPALQNQNIQIPQRILAAYVLNALYDSHDSPSPFHDHLLDIFESERNLAIATSSAKQSPIVGSSRLLNEGGRMQAENEQLVWVLWKILTREVDDLATYSPEILSRITIPEHLRPARLMAHAGSGFDNIRSSSSCPRRTEFTSLPNSIRPPSRSLGDPTTLSQTTYPSSGLPSTHASSRPARNVTPLSPTFSFFDDISSYHRGSFLSSATAHEQTETYGLMQDDPRSNQILGAQFKYQTLTMPGTAHERTYSTVSSVSTHAVRFDFLRSTAGLSHDQRATTEDQRQHLLRALYEQPHSQGSVSGPEYCPSPNYNIRAKEPRWAECQSPLATLNRLGTSAQTNTPQPPQSHHSANYDATSTNAHSSPSHRLRPIPRPTPNIPSNHTTAALAPSSTPRTASTRGGASSQTANIDERLPQEVQVQLNGIAQPSHKLLFSHQLRMQSDSSPSPPTQYPGIIGSGRPSASVPKSSISAENEAAGSRWSHIVGNGRLIFPATVIHDAPEKVQPHATTENEDMIPFSALPLRNSGEETKNKRDFGAIGQPKTEQTNGNDQSTGEPADLLEQLTKLSVGGIVEPQMPAGRTNMASFRLATRSSDSTWPRPQDTDDITTTPSPHCASRSQLFLQPSSQNPLTSNSPLAVGSDLKNDATLVSSHHTFSILPSSLSSTAGYKQLKARPNDSSPFIPAGSTEYERPLEDQINEKKQDALCRAVVLLLNARERVLTLSEQRTLQPHLQMLAEPLSLLRPEDLPSLVAKNPDVATKLLVHLLNRKDEDAANIERVLNGVNQADVSWLSRGPHETSIPSDAIAAMDAVQAVVNFVDSYGATSYASAPKEVSTFGGREAKESYLYALRSLPPTMQSFNLIAKLLRPTAVSSSQPEGSPEFEAAKLIRTEVLGGFVSGSVRWIEQEEKKGNLHDDRVAVATSSLCRFYSSLLKHGFVSPVSEADTTEIMSFALQFSRFEEARSLYSTLAAARA